MSACPCCGQELPAKIYRSADELLHALKTAKPHRELYIGTDGRWHMTYEAGTINTNFVNELVRSGYVQSVYSDMPTTSYHVGKTWDCEATMAARKRGEKINIFTDGTRE
jgi:hypothetical protein